MVARIASTREIAADASAAAGETDRADATTIVNARASVATEASAIRRRAEPTRARAVAPRSSAATISVTAKTTPAASKTACGVAVPSARYGAAVAANAR